jgi:hypothetical protein
LFEKYFGIAVLWFRFHVLVFMEKRCISTNNLYMKDPIWRVSTVTNFEILRYYFEAKDQ